MMRARIGVKRLEVRERTRRFKGWRAWRKGMGGRLFLSDTWGRRSDADETGDVKR